MAKTKLDQINIHLGHIHAARKIVLYSRQSFDWNPDNEWTEQDENYNDVQRGPYHHVVEYKVSPQLRLSKSFIAPRPDGKGDVLQYFFDVSTYVKMQGTTEGAPHLEKYQEFRDSLVPRGVEPFQKPKIDTLLTNGLGPIVELEGLFRFEEDIGVLTSGNMITDEYLLRSGLVNQEKTGNVNAMKRLIEINPYLDTYDMRTQVTLVPAEESFQKGPLARWVAPMIKN
jgi:hypothetical protein